MGKNVILGLKTLKESNKLLFASLMWEASKEYDAGWPIISAQDGYYYSLLELKFLKEAVESGQTAVQQDTLRHWFKNQK